MLQRFVLSLDNGVALTPPMGFNNYMAGKNTKDQKGLKRIADFLLESGMRTLGYEYINTDEGWELKHRHPKTGNLQWNTSMFPDGGNAFIASLHERSFKFGIYGSASPVTCGENPGQLYNEVQDAKTYASWGVDFVKADNCATFALDSSVRYAALRDALNATNKRIVLSIEPFSMSPDPYQSSEVANMWRTGTDIDTDFISILDRADTADKWAPLAGPTLGWNDPDMIHLQNPGSKGLAYGENRIYFGLWAIMKAPLLLSSDLPALDSKVVAIASNPEVISINQDRLGIPARKIQIGEKPLPWLVGVEDCSPPDGAFTYARPVSENSGPKAGRGKVDTRRWKLVRLPNEDDGNGHRATSGEDYPVETHWLIQNEATKRCLSVQNSTDNVVLLPCLNYGSVMTKWQGTNIRNFLWIFDMGLSTITSITNLQTGKALAISDSFLYSRHHYKDHALVSDLAYGGSGVFITKPFDQNNCTGRWCENYEPQQMWYYSPRDGYLRHSLYTSSMNHIENYQDKTQGDGYILTPKVPTFRHNCLAHVLSTDNVGTEASTTEVWGGPLSGDGLVIALVNRGNHTINITANLGLILESSGHYNQHAGFLKKERRDKINGTLSFGKIRDLFRKETIAKQKVLSLEDDIELPVPPHDITLLRLQRKRNRISSDF